MAPKKKGKKRAGSSDFDEALSDDFSDDLDRKLPTPAPALPPPAPALAPVAAPVLIEELWAQCDRCQKWRLLPPGTPPPPDNVPWFCTLNPDRLRNTCDAPEQAWNDQGSIEQPLPQPKKKGGGGGGSSSSKKGGAVKAGTPIADERSALQKKKQRGGAGATAAVMAEALAAARIAPEAVPKVFASAAEELHGLVKACNRILGNLGSWEAPRPGQPLSSLDMQVPPWVWSGLHHFAPGPTRVAEHSLDVLSASEYEEGPSTSAPMGAWAAASLQSTLAPQESTLRLAMMGAAAAALPAAEDALAAANASAAAMAGPAIVKAGLGTGAGAEARGAAATGGIHAPKPEAAAFGMAEPVPQQASASNAQQQQQMWQQQQQQQPAGMPSGAGVGGSVPGHTQVQPQHAYHLQQQAQQAQRATSLPTQAASSAPWPSQPPPLASTAPMSQAQVQAQQQQQQQQQWLAQQQMVQGGQGTPGMSMQGASGMYQSAQGYPAAQAAALRGTVAAGAGGGGNWPAVADGQMQQRQWQQPGQSQGQPQFSQQMRAAPAMGMQQPVWQQQQGGQLGMQQMQQQQQQHQPQQQPQQPQQQQQAMDLNQLHMLNQAFAAQQQQSKMQASHGAAYAVPQMAAQMGGVQGMRGGAAMPAQYQQRQATVPHGFAAPSSNPLNGMGPGGMGAGGMNPNMMAAMNYLQQQQQQQQRR